MEQPTAERALAALEMLVGDWTVAARNAHGEPWPGSGRATFVWHDLRRFLIERSTVDLPESPDGVCVIGCDAANGTYTSVTL
jgi:hypothetical protein